MKTIKGFEEYQIDEDGNVYRYNKLRKQRLSNGYWTVILSKDNKKKNFKTHRLVALTYIPNPNNLPTVNHIDGNKENNNVKNLEWNSYKQNMKHAYDNNLNDLRKKINQLDMDDKFIKEFRSIEDAANELDIKKGNISACANNKRNSAGNFKWSFV